jgi:hypothetical protein
MPSYVLYLVLLLSAVCYHAFPRTETTFQVKVGKVGPGLKRGKHAKRSKKLNGGAIAVLVLLLVAVPALAQIGKVLLQVDQSQAGHFSRDEETDYN